MKLIKINIVCILLLFSLCVTAQERIYKGGWTSIMHEDFVDYCVGSAVKKNMQYLVNKKVFKVGSEHYMRILRKVNQHQSLVCECTHNKIMAIYRYNEINRMMKDKRFIIQIAKNCSKQILIGDNN